MLSAGCAVLTLTQSALTVPPAWDEAVFADELLLFIWQAYGVDAVCEGDASGQLQNGDIIGEPRIVEVGVDDQLPHLVDVLHGYVLTAHPHHHLIGCWVGLTLAATKRHGVIIFNS